MGRSQRSRIGGTEPNPGSHSLNSPEQLALRSGKRGNLERASWLGDFRAELLAFPSVRYDDQVDSISQFLTWRDERKIVRQGHLR